MNHPQHHRILPTGATRGALAGLSARFGVVLAPASALAQGTPAESSYEIPSKYNLQPPVSEIAAQIYDLHTLILAICAVIFVMVFGAMFYAIIKHRKSVGHKPAQFHENTTVEVLWTVVPFLILILMALPATRTVIAMKDTSAPDLTIKATGYQWKWGYDYLKGEGDLKDVSDGITFYSSLATTYEERMNTKPKEADYLLDVDNRLVVPLGKKVRILTTANDVLHAWWVPALGVKQDAIPGFIRDIWFKADKIGVYRGQCAELCGKEHGFMPIVVEVKSIEDFRVWAGEQQKMRMAAAGGAPAVAVAPIEGGASTAAATTPAV
ncbi:MAG: cytochrome c oxidase subunit II, partial [Proteobacteria bacterium]|nr:cytochrome c oxidase subunit II [Burkholderiales bacterium]